MLEIIESIKGQINPMAVVLIIIVIVLAALTIIAQRKPDQFDIRAIIVDNGAVSLVKVGTLTALIVSSWGFVYQTVHSTLTETYFGLYMTIWAANEVATKAIDRFKPKVLRDPPPPDDADAPK